ncbi:hypothetical protein HGRIS_000353 [Hohenbuehelia grisea]|uniref:Uncharacterized protein n=1 Tax=Hohenbuehelia grisea TaxID=104357 RepID=A0ABR3JQT3_9AGAR
MPVRREPPDTDPPIVPPLVSRASDQARLQESKKSPASRRLRFGLKPTKRDAKLPAAVEPNALPKAHEKGDDDEDAQFHGGPMPGRYRDGGMHWQTGGIPPFGFGLDVRAYVALPGERRAGHAARKGGPSRNITDNVAWNSTSMGGAANHTHQGAQSKGMWYQ